MNRPNRNAGSRRGLALGLIALSWLATACVTEGYVLRVTSTPAGAYVYINGKERGQTNNEFRIEFSDCDRVYIQTVRRGYLPGLQTIGREEARIYQIQRREIDFDLVGR